MILLTYNCSTNCQIELKLRNVKQIRILITIWTTIFVGFPTAIGTISEYETEIIPKLLNNAESWLGLNDSHIEKLQNFQDNFIRKVFQVSAAGTPKGMLMLYGQMLSVKWRITEMKSRSIGKTM